MKQGRLATSKAGWVSIQLSNSSSLKSSGGDFWKYRLQIQDDLEVCEAAAAFIVQGLGD